MVPTGAGLPLVLSVEGSSSVQLKSKTKIDLGQFFSTGKRVRVFFLFSLFQLGPSFLGKALAEAHVYPTASVQVEGYMSVKVTPKGSTTGLKSVTKLHASTFVDGRIEVDGGKLVKAEVKNILSDMTIAIE